MSRIKVQLTGMKFGRLTVVKRKDTLWVCSCICGKRALVAGSNLRSGNTTSCGCRRADSLVRHGHARAGNKSAIYRCWRAMHTRCLNPNARDYPSYGGRGITICKRWLTFENFVEDMGNVPMGRKLERKNNNAGYSKRNCTWATTSTQAQNRRSTKLTWEKVRAIRADTRSDAVLAVAYGVRRQTIWSVRANKTWIE